jgi:hypothetical protein
LIHDVEIILPLKSLRIIIQELFNKNNIYLRAKELRALDEKFLKSQQCLECYQARLYRAFNKKMQPHSFLVEDPILRLHQIIMSKRMSYKFLFKEDGSYMI